MRCAAVFGSLVLLLVCSRSTYSSSIPMWEFLSRGEKMSHLFNMFVKQVQDYCSSLSMPDCNKVLLVYGLTNLAKMEEESLDKMDPYQRGATDIIWQSMMKGTYKTPTDNKEPLDYSYTSNGNANGPSPGTGGNNLGSQEEAATNVHQYLAAASNNKYVIGPMVVRVMPDGSPVPGEPSMTLPKDEDAEEFKLMHSKPLPSIEDIMGSRQIPHPAYNGRYQQSQSQAQQQTQQQTQTASQPHAVYVLPPSQFRISNV